MERIQRKIQDKGEITWPPHSLSHVLVTVPVFWPWDAPCKNQSGWQFWCPYRNVDFPAYNRTQAMPQVQIRLQFFERNKSGILDSNGWGNPKFTFNCKNMLHCGLSRADKFIFMTFIFYFPRNWKVRKWNQMVTG